MLSEYRNVAKKLAEMTDQQKHDYTKKNRRQIEKAKPSLLPKRLDWQMKLSKWL
jgi:hypothetical protein